MLIVLRNACQRKYYPIAICRYNAIKGKNTIT